GMLLENGETPPLPCNQTRSEQLNIRISPLEKLRLESATAQGGFRSISDYVRFAAVSGAANKK
ncbi:MAG: hypothetical protein QGF07_04935, partial [Phycisphaerales bacterium]|nr:hypothetical protein [Phycisphaerales bacterium]